VSGASVDVQSFYGRWADLYDRVATAPGVARWRRAAVDALELSAGDTVVEMGCGTGANLPYLRAAVGPTGRVVGVDLTRPLLERARRRTDPGPSNAGVLQADMRAPPVERADAVLGTFVSGMVADPGGVVADWCELCDGRVALLEAASSAHPVGRLLAPAFGAFVGAGQPADSLAGSLENALTRRGLAALDGRVAAARRALTDRATDRRFRTFALGYVGLLSGHVG
jgi:SAM-dependent methyltransferase